MTETIMSKALEKSATQQSADYSKIKETKLTETDNKLTASDKEISKVVPFKFNTSMVWSSVSILIALKSTVLPLLMLKSVPDKLKVCSSKSATGSKVPVPGL